MFVLVTIGVASAIRRILALDGIIPAPVNLNGGNPFDASFGKHPLIAFVHILPVFFL